MPGGMFERLMGMRRDEVKRAVKTHKEADSDDKYTITIPTDVLSRPAEVLTESRMIEALLDFGRGRGAHKYKWLEADEASIVDAWARRTQCRLDDASFWVDGAFMYWWTSDCTDTELQYVQLNRDDEEFESLRVAGDRLIAVTNLNAYVITFSPHNIPATLSFSRRPLGHGEVYY